MRLTSEINRNCGLHRYPVHFHLGDEVSANIDVLVNTTWNGDGYDDDFAGCEWNGVLIVYGGIVDVENQFSRRGTLAAMETYKAMQSRIERDAASVYEDDFHKLMLSRL